MYLLHSPFLVLIPMSMNALHLSVSKGGNDNKLSKKLTLPQSCIFHFTYESCSEEESLL